MNPLDTYRALIERGSDPALTLYGAPAGAPRLELSGKVVANHAAKAANFLADDLMLEPGSRLTLDLPVHWRLLTWALGGLLAGAHLAPDGDTVVTSRPAPAAADVVAVSLGALDMSWPGDLPAGVIDGNAELLGQADALLDASLADASNASAFARPDLAAGPRLLVVDPDQTDLIGLFLHAAVSGTTLVLSDRANAEQARRLEGLQPSAG